MPVGFKHEINIELMPAVRKAMDTDGTPAVTVAHCATVGIGDKAEGASIKLAKLQIEFLFTRIRAVGILAVTQTGDIEGLSLHRENHFPLIALLLFKMQRGL